MMCARCGHDSTYPQRSGGVCPGCRKHFAFEPRTGDPVADMGWKSAIEWVSSHGTVRFTEDHLHHAIARRVKRKSAAAVVGILALTSGAYAQGRSSATMMVSVRVVRSCVVTPSNSDAPSFTTQCSGTAQPRTDVSSTAASSAPASAPAPVTRLAAPGTIAAPVTTAVETSAAVLPESDGAGFRVLTVNC